MAAVDWVHILLAAAAELEGVKEVVVEAVALVDVRMAIPKMVVDLQAMEVPAVRPAIFVHPPSVSARGVVPHANQ